MDAGRAHELQQWIAAEDGRVCAGCRFLANRLFVGWRGPYPPLHDGCRCTLRVVDVSQLSGVALIAAVLGAERNTRQTEALLEEARQRRRKEGDRQHGADRMLRRMTRRAVRRENTEEGTKR